MLRGALGALGGGSPSRARKGAAAEEESNGGANGNAKLAAVLDAADDDGDSPASPLAAAGPRGGPGDEEDLAASAAAEHAARVRAEGAAADASRRLEVAQEQVHEYARARAQDAAEALAEAEAAVARASSSSSSSSDNANNNRDSAGALFALVALRDRLAQASREAAAFAALTKADADRAKRSAAAAAAAAAGLSVAQEEEEEEVGAGKDGAKGEDEGEGEQGVDDMATDSAPPEPKRAREEAASPAAAAALPPSTGTTATMLERAQFIPLRLTADERRLLSLLKAALSVSQYTDKVDILSWKSKTARVHAQIRDMCAILCGLVVASDYKKGQQLVVERNFADNAEFFQDVFEVGRRHKIMNPEKMRTGFGKLAYLLMDSQDPTVQELLEFNPVRPLRTVHSLLARGGALGLLTDPLLPKATAEIASRDRPRADVQRDIRAKERARDALAARYARPKSDLCEEDVLRAIYSIADNEAFLRHARDPVDAALAALEARFSPQLNHSAAVPFDGLDGVEGGVTTRSGAGGGGNVDGEPPSSPTAASAVASLRRSQRTNNNGDQLSLAISGGVAGARLTHSHARQFAYVRQTLALWRSISNDMFKLWCLAQEDLFGAASGGRYRLTDTGQGLQRVQAAPRVGRAMAQLLQETQARLGSWVGSSVVHLGDHNVPNALMFIDKYCQVPLILNPVVSVCLDLPGIAERDKAMKQYMEASFGSVGGAVDAILVDFFRHAFDGSGADNFFDAGSCVDGRLTSAWNWGSKIEKKGYYNLFKVAGFTSFDGKEWTE